MQTTPSSLGSACAAALIVLAGAGEAAAAPSVQAHQVVTQFVGPDAPVPRSNGARTPVRPPLALPAAAAVAAADEASAGADDGGALSVGPLLLALLGLVLLLGLRTRRRDE